MTSPAGESGDRRSVIRLVGVYNADGTLRGELTYWLMARLGRAHCALCTITHGSVRERDDWRAARSTLPVPFDCYHRDDQPHGAATACEGVVPVVVAETPGGYIPLLGPAELDAIDGSPTLLVEAIRARIAELAMQWPDMSTDQRATERSAAPRNQARAIKEDKE